MSASVAPSNQIENRDIAFKLLLEGIRLKFGYDFRDYAESSMRRRIEAVLRNLGLRDPMDVLRRILDEPGYFQDVLPHLTVPTSEMFRDPLFFKSLREKVVPVLQTFPRVNVWCAGCSTGEELYSLSILLHEEGLGDRATLYATDINPRGLRAAREGIYSADAMKAHTTAYLEAGGKESFSKYYTADYGFVKMDSNLVRNVVFSEHNLGLDHVFAECHLIVCRNVLIYFNRPLQERALQLFDQSLRHGGFLGLGSKESLRFFNIAPSFEVVDEKWRIYRKAGVHSGGRHE